MIVDAATDRAFELISQRAADAREAFTPGAVPRFHDTETAAPASRPYFDPLSVSAPGDDYFIVTAPHGGTAYTRDGSLTLRDGVLCTDAGDPVRAVAASGSPSGDVRIDPVDLALGRVKNLRIEVSGDVAYDRTSVDPRNGLPRVQRVVAGTLALARFPAGTRWMASATAGSLSAPPDVQPHVGRPGDGNFGTLEPMRREASRVDVDGSLQKLHDAYVAFDALMAAHHAQGGTAKTAMDLLK